MNQQKPRSAGKLHIGHVLYNDGIFSVDMVFESASFFPGEDEMKSATLAASQHFYRLIHENGFYHHGEPEVSVQPKGQRALTIIMGVRAERKKPAIVMLRDPAEKREEPEPDEGGDQVDDAT